jgi:hypothetical protein
LATFAVVLWFVVPSPIALAETGYEICDDMSGNSSVCAGKDRKKDTLESRVQTVLNWLFFAIGALATVMTIFGGIKYSISAGDSSKITTAKNTITYSIAGLVVALLGSAVVNFVIANVWK